jgi:ubiquinone/menaquinone biosynthesis C-methylase UbiE
MNKETLIKKFDKQASMYENNRHNRVMGAWRAKLLQEATGELLEVAVGAGANFPYYDRNRVQVTAVDFSPEMIRKAEAFARRLKMDARFVTADMEELSYSENQFDTIVSTCSLCGLVNPVGMLNRLNRWCREGGLILLLEHGVSSHRFLASVQQLLDPVAYRISGFTTTAI